jgi:formylglycine-generating enzyme required for sulfatase activity
MPHAYPKYPLRPDASWAAPGFVQADNEPVVCVSWNDAQAYVEWLNRKISGRNGETGAGPYHLPTEAEWEYAARAGTQTVRSWGDAIGANNADCEECGSRWDDRQPAPVGSFPPNPFGLSEMLGSAWEWTEDCDNKDYVGAPTDGSASMAGQLCDRHVVRGGSYTSQAWVLRPATRTFAPADTRANDFGFRVVKTL